MYSRRIYHKDLYHISHTEEARSSAFKVLASPKSPVKQNKREVKVMQQMNKYSTFWLDITCH